MDLVRKLRVDQGSKVDLRKVDPGFTGGFKSQAEGRAEISRLAERITKRQRLFHADGQQSLLIVLQGIDAAGKDGTCWNAMSALGPMGVKVVSFKQPTAEERAHDFLWRINRQVPGRGEIAIFNRSHYEDVLIARVHNLVAKSVWRKRYDAINQWEDLLMREANTRIVKFFLYISKEEQLKRFRDRLEDPDRQWKISESDYSERARWDDYIEAFETVLEKCSTKSAPWYIIPSNRKWFRDLAVSAVLAQVMEDMDLRYPAPSVSIEEIRRLYHAESRGGT